MRDGQRRDVVHTDDALKRRQLDAVVYLWLLEVLGHVVGFGKIDSREVIVVRRRVLLLPKKVVVLVVKFLIERHLVSGDLI